MNLSLKHRSGRQNVNADALLRNPVTCSKKQNVANACEESNCNNVVGYGKVSDCCKSICPVLIVLCPVFAGLVHDNEPNGDCVDSVNTDDTCEVEAVENVTDQKLKERGS